MARRKKKGSKVSSEGWLVTFSDIVTLLLTFFVLLLSMATLDKRIITIAFTNFTDKFMFLQSAESGRVPPRIQLVKEALKDPMSIMEKKQKIKDMLFPDEILPPDINKSTLNKNIDIIKKKEGVAIILTDKILFPSGSYVLKPDAQKILKQIEYLLMLTPVPVNISGHTDITGSRNNNYKLSEERVISVLKFFLNSGKLKPNRFSISAYGPDRPIASNKTAKGRAKNRRVEILLKTRKYSIYFY